MQKALFLDRDGVINVDREYVHRVEDFVFIRGVFELTRAAQDKGYLIIVVTNQSGIGRGYYTEGVFASLTQWMLNEFSMRDIHVSKVYHCPFHSEQAIGDYKRDSYYRKPNPGMILRAKDDFELDLSKSILIGDKASDIQCGQRAGVGRLVLLTQYPCHTKTRRHVAVSTLSEAEEILFSA